MTSDVGNLRGSPEITCTGRLRKEPAAAVGQAPSKSINNMCVWFWWLQEERLDLLGQLEQLPLKVRTEEQEAILQGLTNAELAMWLDLRPYMQRTPFVVQGNASLARAYRLFRTLGLHHLFVGTPKPQVIGVITRKVSVVPSHVLCSHAWTHT